MNMKEYGILGNIIDPTYKDAYDSIGAFKVLPKLIGENKMQVTCMTVVNLLNRSEMQIEAKKAEDQLNKACNLCIKEVKKQFKEEAGRALKVKETSKDLSVELINMSAYSPKGTALVRNVYMFEVS